MANPLDDLPQDRLKALEAKLAKAKGAGQKERPRASRGFAQANMAWRMIVELVTGLLIGFGIGYGLDWLFGTGPLFLVLFILFGFAAGVNVMLRTAREVNREAEAEHSAEGKEEG